MIKTSWKFTVINTICIDMVSHHCVSGDVLLVWNCQRKLFYKLYTCLRRKEIRANNRILMGDQEQWKKNIFLIQVPIWSLSRMSAHVRRNT